MLFIDLWYIFTQHLTYMLHIFSVSLQHVKFVIFFYMAFEVYILMVGIKKKNYR